MIDKVDVLTEDREDEEKQLLWYDERSYLDATNGLKQHGKPSIELAVTSSVGSTKILN